jgi:hypothetical protein
MLSAANFTEGYIMEWVEAPEIGKRKARFIIRVFFGWRRLLGYLILFSGIPLVGTPLARLIKVFLVRWDAVLMLSGLLGALGVALYLFEVARWWLSVSRDLTRVSLNADAVVVVSKKENKTFSYGEFMGFSVEDNPTMRIFLLVRESGAHVAVGIPRAVSSNELRGFMLGKLKEIPIGEVSCPPISFKPGRKSSAKEKRSGIVSPTP